ncbi:MAG TPA: hydroxysqualene dehydroxylase HpnE [Ramlibacter sp.]|uniref:hydroxysqualene dehydroxylase HpnE n=1 Tax=Ramlibacter sp. TaxID=1917967 RepID=UPI002D35ECF0|nr:hydroxysqualene dehydroxylase HpnE [Ramlibacter sp.]HZY19458.1 hydroxysqualene dehydroxylase HpnE [Ramlibacter sp.]
MTAPLKLAVVGGGWAGLAAAVAATQAGHAVTLHEATRQFGGRARTVELAFPDGATVRLDNGQHILIGAYTETLRLMRTVGVDPSQALQRLPLTLRFPDGDGLALPDRAAPWDAIAGIAGARGWSVRDKVSLLRHAVGWQLRRFRCAPQLSVSQLCAGLRPAVMRDLVEPLCVSALNIQADRASAQVFLRVMRDALFAPADGPGAASNLLLPRVDLGRLLPDAAISWLQAQGAEVRAASRVQALSRAAGGWRIGDDSFDAVVLACPPWDAQRLAQSAGACGQGWAAQAAGLAHEAIATVYTTGGPALPLPLLALRSDPGAPAQFVFDRSRLGGPPGLLAWVVSASRTDAATLERQVVDQAGSLGWRVRALKTVVEKRATFACTPGLQRPPVEITDGLLACGDYVAGPYPATLEGAVRSALDAVGRLSAAGRTVA